MKEQLSGPNPEEHKEPGRIFDKVPPYLQQFGYNESTIHLAESMHEVVARNDLVKDAVNVYGEFLTGYLLHPHSSGEARRMSSILKGGYFSNYPLHYAVRLGIAVDYAEHFPIRDNYQSGEFRFASGMGALNHRSMADLIQVAKGEDLAEVHQICRQFADAERDGTIYSYLTRYGEGEVPVLPIAEKYFPKKEIRSEEKTLRGFLEFHSETGTEGGYWAFQDEQFTGIPQKGYPEGIWSYEGLHVLKDEDKLIIFDKEDSGKIVWSGEIQLGEFTIFKESVLGMWIHNDQVGMKREEWAKWFFTENPAKLVTKVRVEDE